MSAVRRAAATSRRCTAVLFAALTAGSIVMAIEQTSVVLNPESHLRTWESGSGHTPVVLLHGYGSSPEDWLPFTPVIHISSTRRFVFPEGPEAMSPPAGPIGGRAWWRLGLEGYRSSADGLPDLSHARPEGLTRSVQTIQLLIRDLHTRLNYPKNRLIVGGFSQGAMVAADLAFRTDEPMQALVLLSPTFVDEQGWLPLMRHRAGLPVFVAHGREDPTLSFASTDRLQRTMDNAGLRVTWVPFAGGHEVPAEVVAALNRFLAAVGE